MNIWLFFIPFAGALVGFLVNHLIIKSLFYPRRMKKIFGIRFLGMIPKNKNAFAESLEIFVNEKLFLFGELEKKSMDPSNLNKVMPLIEEHIDEFLKVKLTKEMPFLSMFISNKTISSLKNTFMKELEILFPQVMKNYSLNLKSELNPGGIVKQKVSSIPVEEIESMFYKGMSKQIRLFKIIGAFAGFFTGIIDIIITILIT